MSHNKYKITIEYSHDNFYKVQLTDHNGARNVVYEPSVDRAFDYAINWCREADTREEARQVHARACLLYTSPSPRDRQKSRMPSSA